MPHHPAGQQPRDAMPRRLIFNAFSMNCVSHIQHGLWGRPDTRQTEYTTLDPWLELAAILERGCFDTLFLADVMGVYDNYRGGPETSIREAMQIPVNDPTMLVPAMAAVTEHLGFAFTSTVLAEHPFNFARKVSTLDHLTRGRIAWNIVTSYLPSAARNLGHGDLPPHDDRYDRGDEYLEVLYKLWEASWEDDAVVRRPGCYADPAKVHRIDHVGRYYDVPGPHLCEPSPQRTPVLFQAGSSDRGREFAARHAECIFVIANRRSLPAVVRDIGERAARYGRHPDDLRFIVPISPIVGGTEAEARAKEAEIRHELSTDAGLAHMSGSIGADLGSLDPDRPIGDFDFNSMTGILKSIAESAPDKTLTFGDLARRQMSGQFLTGTPEQLADRIEDFARSGADGFNLVYSSTPGTFVEFIDGVAPVLQSRGLMQTEHAPGTLREKLFGGGAHLASRHPGRRLTRQA